MPSSWSARLLSNSNTPTRGSTTANSRERPQLRLPNEYLDPPTLNAERPLPSPTRPQPSGTSKNSHNRSTSNPLPKFFQRKKSNGNLPFVDTDLQLDDELVPVLDQPSDSAPTRVISGKKNRADDDVKTSRRCMCCDSRVKVPKELDKFRCLHCLTINDLKPVEEQSDEDRSRSKANASPGTFPVGVRPPISVERSRAIIDRCVTAYLEARCRRFEDASSTSDTAPSKADLDVTGFHPSTSPVKSDDNQAAEKGYLMDIPASSSPHDSEGATKILLPAATIRDFVAYEQFAQSSTDPSLQEQPVRQNSSSTVSRKPVPSKPTRKPPPPPPSEHAPKPEERLQTRRLQPVASTTSNARTSPRLPPSSRPTTKDLERRRRYERVKTIFGPLEDYMIASFGNVACLNASFSTVRPTVGNRTRSDNDVERMPTGPLVDPSSPVDALSELDAKTLLLGDIGENGSWWTGKYDRKRSDKTIKRKKVAEGTRKMVSMRSPNINWAELNSWYDMIHTAGLEWREKIDFIASDDFGFSKASLEGRTNTEEIEEDLIEARDHAIRALLKITENILKRPTRPIRHPEDVRFLLICLYNPSLYPSINGPTRSTSNVRDYLDASSGLISPRKSPAREASQHTGLLKRIFGLLAHSSDACHRCLIGWFARFDEQHFVRLVDLVASFVTHRIARRSGRPHRKSAVDDGGLIPDLSGSAMNTSAQLHAAMGLSGSVKKRSEDPDAEPDWAGDWQIKGAAKVMSMLFAANNTWQGKRRNADSSLVDSFVPGSSLSPQVKARRSGQLLHTSNFYNTLLDYHDMIADFKVWESKRDKFAFCQFPLFLSMGNKIKILEYDARRQMEIKAREAYFDQVIRQRAIDGYFHLRVRRECLVDDSLRQISEAVGAGQEELKKGLRVHFTGEEGVDAGGPRKEWFLMLVRDIFDPNHGMFVYDDDSLACYFNPHSFETSDQYYLVGALLGLAIYNSTILDVALPPFAFRKLLAAAPSTLTSISNVSSLTGTKGQMTYTLSDLAEFRPTLAKGLQQLLDFDGDVESTYCRDFVAPVERYGAITNVPLISNGNKTPVTNSNRHEFVDAYVRYLLDAAVSRQFEPFKRGFFTVCAGNALSLFRAEEIELLVRGSDESLDVDSLRAVAVYENWRHFQPPHPTISNPADSVPVIAWFWDCFAHASPDNQRKLLTFITGTDRIPAVGATSLILRIVAGGDGWGGGGRDERARFPVARTCFNMLVLWRYDYREQLEEKLWRAVHESEGFGLK